MAATKYPVVVVEGTKLTRAQTCTTADCTKPRIRMNALKCAEHEIEYRAAAKARAAARKATAAAAAAKATRATRAAKRANANANANATRTPPTREMGSGPVARA